MPDLVFISVLIFCAVILMSWSLASTGISMAHRVAQNSNEVVERRLSGLFVFADTRRVMRIYILLAAVLAVILLLLGLPTVVVCVIVLVAILLPGRAIAMMERRRRRQLQESLPETLSQMSAALKSGATLDAAIDAQVSENAGPIAQEFSLLLREQKLGIRLSEALENLADRVQSEEMDLVVSAAIVAHEVGGNLSEVLQQLSITLLRKLEMDSKIRALTAQGVLQGWVVGLLPFGILAALMLIEPETVKPVFSSLLGWIFLGLVCVLEFSGRDVDSKNRVYRCLASAIHNGSGIPGRRYTGPYILDTVVLPAITEKLFLTICPVRHIKQSVWTVRPLPAVPERKNSLQVQRASTAWQLYY